MILTENWLQAVLRFYSRKW